MKVSKILSWAGPAVTRKRGDKHTLVQEETSGKEGLWVGRVGSTTSKSQSIRLSSSTITTNISTGADSAAGSHTWSVGTSGLASRTDLAAGSGSVVGFVSGSMSVMGNGWVSQSAVGSGSVSVSAVGVGTGSGSGAVMDGERDLTLTAGSSSTTPTAKEDPSTQRAKLMYLASVQQECFPGASPAGSHR